MAKTYSTKREVREKVVEIIKEQFTLSLAGGREITDGMSLTADIGADALDMVELTMNIENEFGISIPEAESVDDEEYTTIGNLVNHVAERLGVR